MKLFRFDDAVTNLYCLCGQSCTWVLIVDPYIHINGVQLLVVLGCHCCVYSMLGPYEDSIPLTVV